MIRSFRLWIAKKEIRNLEEEKNVLETDNEQWRRENIRLGGIVENLNMILKDVLEKKK